MADLKWEVAQGLAASLMSIGHPYNQAVIDATALDLCHWCKGAIIGGCAWTPEKQAEELVQEARTTWDGWPDKGGTKQLLELFRSKYAPKPKQVTEEERIAALIARGLLSEPCVFCRDEGQKYCQYGGAKRHAIESAAEQARRQVIINVTVSPKPKPSISLDLLLARANAAHQDEQRRKREQLDDTRCA